MRTHRRTCVVAIAALLWLSSSDARSAVTTTGCLAPDSCTLAELFAGGSIEIPGLALFADWELEFLDPDGVQPDFTQIVVRGRDDGGVDPGPGLEFTGNGELLVSGSDRLELAVGFTVTELDPGFGVRDNSLRILADTVIGGAFLTIGEFVADGSGVGLGQKEVETDPAFGTSISTDAIEFPAQAKLVVEKDILVVGAAAADFGELDVFEQRFSQLPEPNATLALLCGIGALLLLRRQRRDARPGDRQAST